MLQSLSGGGKVYGSRAGGGVFCCCCCEGDGVVRSTTQEVSMNESLLGTAWKCLSK